MEDLKSHNTWLFKQMLLLISLSVILDFTVYQMFTAIIASSINRKHPSDYSYLLKSEWLTHMLTSYEMWNPIPSQPLPSLSHHYIYILTILFNLQKKNKKNFFCYQQPSFVVVCAAVDVCLHPSRKTVSPTQVWVWPVPLSCLFLLYK